MNTKCGNMLLRYFGNRISVPKLWYWLSGPLGSELLRQLSFIDHLVFILVRNFSFSFFFFFYCFE